MRSPLMRVPFVALACLLASCDGDRSPTGPGSIDNTWHGTLSVPGALGFCDVYSLTPRSVEISAVLSTSGDNLEAQFSGESGVSCHGSGEVDGSEFTLRFESCSELLPLRLLCDFGAGTTRPVTGFWIQGWFATSRLEGQGMFTADEPGWEHLLQLSLTR